MPTLEFPSDAVPCGPGDLLLRREADGRWRVFRVEDVVRLERLVRLGPALAREADLRDSEPPAYEGRVHLLVSALAEEFASEAEAAAAARSGARWNEGVGPLCLDSGHFPRDQTVVLPG